MNGCKSFCPYLVDCLFTRMMCPLSMKSAASCLSVIGASANVPGVKVRSTLFIRFRASRVMLWSLVHFWLSFKQTEKDVVSFFSTHGYLAWLVPFAEDAVFPPMCIFGFCQKSVEWKSIGLDPGL